MEAFKRLLAALCSVRTMALAYQIRPNCHTLMLNVPVTAVNYVLDVVHVNNNIEAVQFALDIDTRTSPNATEISERILGNVTITDSFSIKAQLCVPEAGSDKHVMQILTHGLLVDSRYWDIEIDPAQYSYVYAAVNAGYTVLTYDRLSVGLSEKPDAYTVVQGPLELEILRVITESVRNGSLMTSLVDPSKTSLTSPPVQLEAFDKVVHVGHSYGSFLTAALLTAYGNLSSAAIITGFIFTTEPTLNGPTVAGGFEYAASNNPALFGDRGGGYIVPATVSNLQTAFYHRDNASDPAGFTEELLAYGEFIKQPLTVAEWLSIRGLLAFGYAPEFEGPVQFFEGEHDILLCGGDCKNDYDPTMLKMLYPNATDIDVYIQPGAGHGLTLHRNASAGYTVMLDWLDRNGL